MSKDNDLVVYRGKATNIQMESIHGKVADAFDKALSGIENRHNAYVEMLRATAEDEGSEFIEPEFSLSKEDLAVLAEAQKFLKANNVEMSVVKKSGSKSFSSKINKFNSEKKEIILS